MFIYKIISLTNKVVHTDENAIYQRLAQWGYEHKSVCHGSGEHVRDEDGDGFHEVHVNTIEGFRSLLRYLLNRSTQKRSLLWQRLTVV